MQPFSRIRSLNYLFPHSFFLDSFSDAVRTIFSLQSSGVSLPNHNTWEEWIHFIKTLAFPLHEIPTIHIAGTKGKGSTSAFVESILRENGLKTGLFTSPHLRSIRERIRIGFKPISESQFASSFFRLYDILDRSRTEEFTEIPSFFRYTTLMALETFVREKVDVMIMEVGIGGRLDPTNIVHPTVTGITKLGYDHMNYLGNSISQIAYEKAGIMKNNVPAFTVNQVPEALEKIREISGLVHAPLSVVSPLSLLSQELGTPLLPSLQGDHQIENAALAVSLARKFLAEREIQLQPKAFSDGLANTIWPGRCQKIAKGSNTLWIDAAHTPGSMSIACDWFLNNHSQTPILVFNSTGSRDPKNLLQPLLNIPWEQVLFCPNLMHKSSQSYNLDEKVTAWESISNIPCHSFPSTLDCINYIHTLTSSDILVTGSVHLVGDVLEIENVPTT